MTTDERPIFEFAGFRLEPSERRLTKSGAPVPLTPKAFDLLVIFVREAGRMQTKDGLLAALWPGRIVTEANLTKLVWALRRALDPPGATASLIETTSKAGYRFVATVTRGAESPPPAMSVAPGAALRWRSPALAAAAAVIALAAAALMAPRFASAPTGVGASAPGVGVSLLGFRNLSGAAPDAWIGPTLQQTLGSELALSGKVRLAPAELTAPVEAALPAAGPGGYAPATLGEVRRRLGSDYVLSGDYLVSGAATDVSVRLDAILQPTAGGAPIVATRSGALADLPTLVAALGDDLRRRLAGAAGDENLSGALQAPNAETMRHIGLAEAALRSYDAAAARDEALDAVAGAPGYAPAYDVLARAWGALGYQQKAQAAAAQAAAYATSLPEPVRLEIEAERQRTAFDWAGASATLRRLAALRPGDPEPQLGLVQALINGGKLDEASVALARLPTADASSAKDPRIELAAARLAAAKDDAAGERAHATAALREAKLMGETGLAADAEMLVGLAAGDADPAAATASLGAALADYGRIGNPHGVAWAHQNLGNVLSERDPPRARREYETAMSGFAAIGDQGGVAAVLSNLAIMLWAEGDGDGAETAARQVLQIRRATGDLVGQAWALTALAIADSDASADDNVVREFREAAALDREAGAKAHEAFTLYSLADVLRLRGDLGEAASDCASAQAAYAALGDAGGRDGAAFVCAEAALDRGDAAGAMRAAAALAAAPGASAMAMANAQLLEGEIAAEGGACQSALATFGSAERGYAAAEEVTGQALAASYAAVCDARLGQAAARDAAAARARALRGRVNERQEVLAADINMAQVEAGRDPGRAAATLDAIAADAGRRGWSEWALEARLAAARTLPPPRRTAALAAVATDARRLGFGWIAARAGVGDKPR